MATSYKRLLIASVILTVGLISKGGVAKSAFEGLSGQLSTGYENNSSASTTFQTNTAPYALSIPSSSKGSVPLVVGLGYSFSILPQYLLGLGADYSTISSTLNNSSIACASGCTGIQGQVKVSNRYSIYLTPAYEIDKDKLAYLKAGYTTQQVQQQQFTVNQQPYQYGSATAGGYVIGLGYKQIINGGLYGFGELNYFSYSQVSLNNALRGGATVSGNNPSTSAYNLLVGLGYRF